MIPVLLRLGPITIHSFGLMMAVGFIASDFVLARESRRRGYSPELANAIVVWGAIAGIAGSRIYDLFDNWAFYMADPWSIVLSGAGFVWYGGLIAGVAATWLVARHYRVPFLTVADMCAPALILGQAFGRIGCQLSGDGDWGLPSTLPWAMAYPRAIVGWHGDIHLANGNFIPSTMLKLDPHGVLTDAFFPGVRVHPAPIYETLLYVAVFCVLWALRTRINVEGRILYLYLILAGAARFVVEFVRINPRVLWGLSEAQLISLVMMGAGTAAWYWSMVRQPAHGARQAVRA